MIPQPYFNHDTDDTHHPKEDLYPSILKMMVFSHLNTDSPFQILEYTMDNSSTCDDKMEEFTSSTARLPIQAHASPRAAGSMSTIEVSLFNRTEHTINSYGSEDYNIESLISRSKFMIVPSYTAICELANDSRRLAPLFTSACVDSISTKL